LPDTEDPTRPTDQALLHYVTPEMDKAIDTHARTIRLMQPLPVSVTIRRDCGSSPQRLAG
jgi:hypothetical protein